MENHKPNPGRDETLLQKEERLFNYNGPDRVVTSNEVIEAIDARPKPVRVFKTGIQRLDEKMENLEPGELIVVSGPTGHGKTTVMDTIGRNMAKAGDNVLWFTYEVTPEKFLEKYRKPGIPPVLMPLELKTSRLDWIEERIHEAKLKHDCRVVIVDHLHFLVDEVEQRNVTYAVGNVIKRIKRIALEHRVLIFLLAHLTKVKFEEREPSENDLRDSSFIPQYSDGVWIIYRRLDPSKDMGDDEPFSNLSRIVICKARRSGAYRVKVNLKKVGDDIVEDSIVEDIKKEGQKSVWDY